MSKKLDNPDTNPTKTSMKENRLLLGLSISDLAQGGAPRESAPASIVAQQFAV